MSIARALPVAIADNPSGGTPSRAGRYQEGYEIPLGGIANKHNYADEGSYFVLTNPTPGTALAFAVNASSDFTKSLFLFKNNAASGGKRCYLDYVKILPTTAAASATSCQVAVQVDAAGVNRYTSGGTGPVAGVNVNGDSDTTSAAQVYYASGGAVITTAAAGGSVRLVHRSTPRSVIPAVLEEVVIQFGGAGDCGSSSGTTAGRSSTNGAPVIVGPQETAVFNVWFPSNAITGLSYEFEMGWIER